MRNYILRRLLILIPIMLGVSFLTFAMFRMIPGDAAVLRCQLGCTPEVLNDLRHEMGLDRPWYQQYGDWLWDVGHGDLGKSLTESRLPVTTELDRRLPITGELLVMTMIMALLLGIPPGVISAIRPGTPLDWLARLGSVLWLSIPSFWLGILVIAFGVSWFNWTPPQFGRGYVPFMDDPWVNLQQFFFPSLVLALAIAAAIMRLTRSSLLEVLGNDYIRTAWSKGLRERTVVMRHALKNALIPVLTIVGLQVGALIGGSVIIESVFNLNGVGKYVLEAILRRDFFVVQSVVLLFAVAFVTANLVVDILYGWLDPRIRYG
ncbi:MAG TPA: ABC transporter permease [Dehalococcoidia bacterium]|nr:ABC transporter permease [Dehalococcoidia bacterium]